MKTYLRLLNLVLAMVVPFTIWANVIVKGHVTYQNGQALPYYSVNIQTDSASVVCPAKHAKYTDANGFYIDTLICNTLITNVNVSVTECNNQIVTHRVSVSTSGIAESNFSVCVAGNCSADFNWETISGANNSIRFHSEKSSAGGNGDSIISRKWTYGDGDSAIGNIVAPDHHYQKPGNYNICLSIRTKFGCERMECHMINVTQLAGTCRAKFSYEIIIPQPLNGYAIRFHSNSTATTNDSIIAYHWRFGDGQVLDSNVPNPLHTYTFSQNTFVCLTIVSSGGCMDSICQSIFIPQTHCQALFEYSKSGDSIFHFNAKPSSAIAGDTITQYQWKFGDGGTANTKDPIHNYTKPGYYFACLKIITKLGCMDSSCQYLVINRKDCHAKFTYLPIVDANNIVAGTIHFNAQPSTVGTGDSLTQYQWNFGDGFTAFTKDPYHTYSKASNYLACLTIVSSGGCRDSTCTNITIAAPAPTTCSANFTFTDTGLNGHFNSAQIKVSTGDSIISRLWSFGDGQTLAGNVVSPLHRYKEKGEYQVCLKITTRLGCASESCKSIHIEGDSIKPNYDFIKIVNVYPNPATTQFNAVIYSRYNNVDATLAIYDVYGAVKWSTKKVLSQGNSTVAIPISQLVSGPYIFKVTTIYGVDSKRFFKL